MFNLISVLFIGCELYIKGLPNSFQFTLTGSLSFLPFSV